ncbi:YwqJ-related putative deaminase, partial [Streptomyces niger]|uniref:YwqJ-related putative deaminase n=1 Tax=Streptomyces niger TaxID=66373 RepID=UPI0018FE713D
VGVDGWDAAGQAWKGLAQLVTGLAFAVSPGVQTLFGTLPDDQLPSWIRESRNTLKATGKALVAWDEWGKNPARAAGGVTFNVLTTVFTGGAGGAAAGVGKAGAVTRAISMAGKVGKVIDPMTYVGKAAGAGLSKVGDIAKSLKGIGKVDVSALPADAIKLPEGSLRLPDGTGPGESARYFDGQGNLLDEHGKVLHSIDDAPKEGSPTASPHAGADTPRIETPAKAPALVGAGAHTTDDVSHVRLGDSLDKDLGDVGRAGDDAHTPDASAGDHIPGATAGVHLANSGMGDHLPVGQAGHHLPGRGLGDHLPGSSADDLGTRPSASHEPSGVADGHGDGSSGYGHGDGSAGSHDRTPNDRGDDLGHHETDDGAHHGASDAHHSHFENFGDDGLPSGHDTNDFGESHHRSPDGSGGEPHGSHIDPQPDWHGGSADKMRHHRRSALDVSHLSPEDQLSVLERESAELADDAFDTPPGEAPTGKNHLNKGCAGSFLHDNVITSHSSTTKMNGQKLPHTHQVLDGMLKEIAERADSTPGIKKGLGHGKCAEISLISDRLHQLDPTGTSIRTTEEAKRVLEGSVMHTRQIGDLYDRQTGELARSHGDFLPPCETCGQILPQLGIRVP